jgi:hypothetical protein
MKMKKLAILLAIEIVVMTGLVIWLAGGSGAAGRGNAFATVIYGFLG